MHKRMNLKPFVQYSVVVLHERDAFMSTSVRHGHRCQYECFLFIQANLLHFAWRLSHFGHGRLETQQRGRGRR